MTIRTEKIAYVLLILNIAMVAAGALGFAWQSKRAAAIRTTPRNVASALVGSTLSPLT